MMRTTFAVRRRAVLAGLLFAVALLAPGLAGAQVVPTTSTIACGAPVDPTYPCRDLDLRVTTAGAPVNGLDFFRLGLATSGWTFDPQTGQPQSSGQAGEAEDAVWGLSVYSPTVQGTGSTIRGDFDPAMALFMDPWVRLRAQTSPETASAFADASQLDVAYIGGIGRAMVGGETGLFGQRSSMDAACIAGSPAGCWEIDFTFTVAGPSLLGSTQSLDYFQIWLGGTDGWAFNPWVQPGVGVDANGALSYTSTVTDGGHTLTGTFATPEVLGDGNFAYTVRTYFQGADSTALHFVYDAGRDGDMQWAGTNDVTVENVNTMPEPGSIALLGSGLLILGAHVRRRAKRR